MKLEQLKYFHEAARLQHVGRAGKSLHISPSAISFAIASLEDELQTPLFDRVGNRIYLSAEGKHLKQRAEALFDFVDQIRNEFVSGKNKGFAGDFKVGGSHFLVTHYLIDVWNRLQNENPGLIGEVSPGRTASVMKDILGGTLDLGLCFSPLKHPDLETQELHRGNLLLAVRKGHPLVKEFSRTKKNLSRLSNYSAVIHKAVPGIDICEDHPEFVRNGIRCHIANYFESDDLAVKTVESSDFWTLLPDMVVRHHRSRLVALPLPQDWDAPYTVNTVVRKARSASPVVTLFKERLEKAFSKMK